MQKILVYTKYRIKEPSLPLRSTGKIMRSRVDILKLNHPFQDISTFTIEYENATSKDFHSEYRPTEKEIEAFCSGVDAERKRFFELLTTACDSETLQNIISFQKRDTKRFEEKNDLWFKESE